jgi:hypothetical protein
VATPKYLNGLTYYQRITLRIKGFPYFRATGSILELLVNGPLIQEKTGRFLGEPNTSLGKWVGYPVYLF